jgi:hypothetical protein
LKEKAEVEKIIAKNYKLAEERILERQKILEEDTEKIIKRTEEEDKEEERREASIKRSNEIDETLASARNYLAKIALQRKNAIIQEREQRKVNARQADRASAANHNSVISGVSSTRPQNRAYQDTRALMDSSPSTWNGERVY